MSAENNINNHYNEALSIWEKLSDKEKFWVTPHGCFINSPRLICRLIKYVNNKPVGFVDAYKRKKSRTAFIVIVILKEYRNQGIAHELIEQIENELQDKGYKYVEYIVFKENTKSISFAISCDFKFMTENHEKVFFKKII